MPPAARPMRSRRYIARRRVLVRRRRWDQGRDGSPRPLRGHKDVRVASRSRLFGNATRASGRFQEAPDQ